MSPASDSNRTRKQGPIPVEQPSMPAEKNQVGNLDVPEDYYEQVKDQVRRRIAAQLRFAHRVLDVGCGSCELDRFLAEQNGQEVVGVDISGGSFPANDALGERVRCWKADARKLDFIEDHSVDAVVSVHALHEMEKPLEVLREANRVLRDGGEMLVVDFPRDSLAQRLWNEDYYAPTEVAGMLRQAGFANVESRRIAQRQLIWAEARKAPAGEEMP